MASKLCQDIFINTYSALKCVCFRERKMYEAVLGKKLQTHSVENLLLENINHPC